MVGGAERAQSLWDYSNRLLLREAVQRAEAPDQIHRVNADAGTVLEQLAQNAEHPTLCGRCVEAVKQFKA